jgi:large subunit ribosomal protein L25
MLKETAILPGGLNGMQTMLKAESRSGNATKSELRQMREQGKIPAVVYGKKVPSTPIAIDAKELNAFLKSNPHSIIEMDVPGQGRFPVMLHGLHRDSLDRSLLHVDFQQINMDEPIRTTVALEFTGESPAQREGGVLTVVQHEVEVRCLPQHLPSVIHADISGLGLGDSLMAGDLKLPPEIELKTDDNAVLATILVPQKGTAEADEAKPAEASDAKSAEETV